MPVVDVEDEQAVAAVLEVVADAGHRHVEQPTLLGPGRRPAAERAHGRPDEGRDRQDPSRVQDEACSCSCSRMPEGCSPGGSREGHPTVTRPESRHNGPSPLRSIAEVGGGTRPGAGHPRRDASRMGSSFVISCPHGRPSGGGAIAVDGGLQRMAGAGPRGAAGGGPGRSRRDPGDRRPAQPVRVGRRGGAAVRPQALDLAAGGRGDRRAPPRGGDRL